MNLIAIDPGTNKTGIAYFQDGVLKACTSLTATDAVPLSYKRAALARRVSNVITMIVQDSRSYEVVSEEPFLRGPANTSMSRFLGMLELIFGGKINYIHPSTVKAFFKTKEKIDVAIAAGAYLKTPEEQNRLARAIADEEFEATDAGALGIAFMEKNKT